MSPARQPRHSFGRIRKRPSGRYQAGFIGPDQQLHYAPFTFARKGDAEAWLHEERRILETYLDDPDRYAWVPPKERAAVAAAEAELAELARPPALREYAAGWLDSRTLKPSTRHEYRATLDRYVLPSLGEKRLDELTPLVVRAWHTALGPNKPSARTHAYQLLKTIMGTAVREQIIDKNPCVLPATGAGKAKHQAVPATLEELAIIVSNMPDRLQLAVLIAAWCGLRQGEVMELRRKDIDLVKGQLHVRRGVTHVPGQGIVVGTPKTAAGARTVAIPPHLLPEFRRHLAEHVPLGKESLLFVGRDSGQQLSSSTLYRSYYPAREAAGRPDLRWHDLRHTGATLAAATGATLAELMLRMGHSTAGAAMRYQHATQDRDQAIAAALSRMATVTPLHERAEKHG